MPYSVSLYHLCYLILGIGRQAQDRDGVIVSKDQLTAALDMTRFVIAIEVVVGFIIRHIMRLPVCSYFYLPQLHLELEILSVVRRGQIAPSHFLADGQFAGVCISDGLVSDHHHVQQTKEVGQIGVAQYVSVDALVGVLILVVKSHLLDPGADETGVCDKEGLEILAAVFIVEAVVHFCIFPKVQVHAAEDICSFQYCVLPVGEGKTVPTGLGLHEGRDILEGDIHIVALRILAHGLGQLAHASHHRYAVISITCVGVNRVAANDHRDYGCILGVALRRSDFLQIVSGLGAAIGPIHLCVTGSVLLTSGRKNQHPLVISNSRCHRGSIAALIVIQPKFRFLQRLTVLIHLQHPQLPALVWDVDHGAEIPVELVHLEEFIAGRSCMSQCRVALLSIAAFKP